MRENRKTVPVIYLRGLCIIPGVKVNFDISRKKSIDALEAAMNEDKQVFVVTQKNIEESNPAGEDLNEIGVLAMVSQVVKLPGSNARILIENSTRAKCVEYTEKEEAGYIRAEVEELPDYLDDMDAVEKEAKAAMLKELIAGYASKRPKTGQESLRVLCLFQELPVLLKRTMSAIPMSFEKKQHYLNVDKLSEKYELAYKFIQEEINILEIREDFQSKIKEKVEENQKEYILREQMKVIRQELGEEDTVQESDTFLQSTEALDAPEEIKEKLRKEIKRYKTLSSGSAESSVARG